MRLAMQINRVTLGVTVRVGLFVWAIALTASCQAPDSSKDMMRRFATGMVDATDLPFGWGDRRSTAAEVPGAIGRNITYYAEGPGRSYVNVGQQMMIYPDESAARLAYETIVAESFPAEYADRWLTPPELEFQGRSDQMKIACLSGAINGIPFEGCSVVARYKDMVMDLTANVFENRWLTMEQFRRLVERVDAKMYRASQLSPDGP